jgi:ATP-dependent DNA helicase RecG
LSQEGQLLDQKSLRSVTGKSADWNELVKDCIAFANATGGRLLLGIEDGQNEPPASQRIPADLPDTIRRKIAERCVNVAVLPDIVTAANDGQYINLAIPRAIAVASTTDGRYFLRVADQSKPVTGDDVLRLAAERAALPWETQTTLQISSGRCHEKPIGQAASYRPWPGNRKWTIHSKRPNKSKPSIDHHGCLVVDSGTTGPHSRTYA